MSTYRIQATSVEASQFSGSFVGDGSGLTGVGGSTPTGSLLTTASVSLNTITFTKGDSSTFNITVDTGSVGNIVGIATGSITASVTPTQFSVISGSSTELLVTGTGVTIGSALTDLHTVTGSLNITGSLSATSITAVPRGYYYFMTQSAQSVSTGSGAEQSLTNITIPANTIQVGDRIEIIWNLATPANTGTKAFRVRINGATSTTGTILNFGTTLAASITGWHNQISYRQSTTTLINGSTFYYGAPVTVAQVQNSASLDITQANTFYFNAIRNGASDTITLLDCYVKILR